MKRGIPLVFKRSPYYHKVKDLLPQPIRHALAGDLVRHQQRMLIDSAVKNKDILPTMMCIELTNHCNAKCTFCTQPEIMTRPKKHMPDIVMEECLTAIEKYNISEVMLAGMGEPFLYKKLLPVIGRLKKMGVLVSITTNGSVLHVMEPSEIVESGLDKLLISMDAIETGWLHQSKPGIKKTVDEIEQDIRDIYAYREERGRSTPLIRLKYQVLEDSNFMEDKEKEKEIILSKVGVLCDEVDLRKQHDWLGEAAEGVGNHTLPKATMNNICNQLIRTMEVSWNGDVGLCCMDFDNKVILGNILESDIKPIFNAEPIKEARRMYVNGSAAFHPMCSGCYTA